MIVFVVDVEEDTIDFIVIEGFDFIDGEAIDFDDIDDVCSSSWPV